jgi:hypothetical protein
LLGSPRRHHAAKPARINEGLPHPSRTPLTPNGVLGVSSDSQLRTRNRHLASFLAVSHQSAEGVGYGGPGMRSWPVGFANSGGLVFVDESAEEITTL